MNDPRLTLIHDGLAAAALEGLVEADRYAKTEAMRCVSPWAGIHKAADATSEQQDQLVFGEAFDVLVRKDGFAFGQARRDGYVGWVEDSALGEGVLTPTHWVSALRTYAFSKPDLKSAPAMALTMNALVTIEARDGRFARAAGAGWIFEDHLSPMGACAADPAGVALRFAEAPYLWGGRTSEGLDCSGLVQQAHYACAVATCRDTDMQAQLGALVDAEKLQRGDLVFWKGHVGVMSDGKTLFHANAYHMAARAEPLAVAAARIKAAGAGAPTGYRRIV
jgi:cell wall-associated NlpC family hydrolase